MLWPSGVVQAESAGETGPGSPTPVVLTALPSIVTVEELNRKPSSCPFLYTWNGERFEFVTDFLGGGEMGYWERPRTYNRPDPIEFVRIRDEQLHAKNGRYEIRVTNELEETLFLDRLQLMAIDHPRNISVYPNEGMTDPPKPFRLFAVTDQRAPTVVTDGGGRVVTEQSSRWIDSTVDNFELRTIRGYAAPHDLVIELGSVPPRPVLLLTGWTDYAFSSDNVAAHQAGLGLTPPRLDVRDSEGRWRPAIADIGIPVGRPQTIVVDLAPALRAGEHAVRVTTNMRIYWDQSRWRPRTTARRCDHVARSVVRAAQEPRFLTGNPSRRLRTADLRLRQRHRRLSLEDGSWALYARGRRTAAALPQRRHVRRRETRRRNRAQLRRIYASPAALRMDAHLPSQRRRVQQGNGRELREPGSCRAFAIPPYVRVPWTVHQRCIRSRPRIDNIARSTTRVVSLSLFHRCKAAAMPGTDRPANGRRFA